MVAGVVEGVVERVEAPVELVGAPSLCMWTSVAEPTPTAATAPSAVLARMGPCISEGRGKRP